MIGQNVQANPGAVRRMVDLGCELGNHTWSHTRLTTMSASEREADFLKTNQAIQEASGGTPVTVIRPPWGAS
jgi:peptidoglycan/xylan/chitin deacetylase (PgdA/CDA1 family)